MAKNGAHTYYTAECTFLIYAARSVTHPCEAPAVLCNDPGSTVSIHRVSLLQPFSFDVKARPAIFLGAPLPKLLNIRNSRKAVAALFFAIAFRFGHSGAQEPPRDAHGRVRTKVSEFRILRDYHAPLLLHSLKRQQPTSPSCPCMVTAL
jgi:hypothetical protein